MAQDNLDHVFSQLEMALAGEVLVADEMPVPDTVDTPDLADENVSIPDAIELLLVGGTLLFLQWAMELLTAWLQRRRP